MRLICFSLLVGVLGLLLSCKKDGRLPETEFPDYAREFWAKGTVRNPLTGAKEDFDVAVGSNVVSNSACRNTGFPYRWSVCSFESGAYGETCTFYFMGRAASQDRPVCPTPWTKLAAENNLQAGFSLPIDSVENGVFFTLYNPNSTLGNGQFTSTGINPDDFLTIEAVSDYYWEGPSPAKTLQGKRLQVRFQITLKNGFVVTDGEAVLFVPYVP
jgi:hypothetical protein